MRMIFYQAVTALFVASVFTQSSLHAVEAPALMAQALELLQKNEKAKALKLLEKAFETAQDPEAVKEAAALIISASSEKYPKREAYLRYLTQRHRDHPDSSKWFKELGDRAFDRGDFNQAEEYYLNAQTQSDDSFLIKYKLAYTYWNQKRKVEAMSVFLDLALRAHTGADHDTESLRDQLKRDIAKVWWETGPLPASTFAKIFLGPQDYQDQVFSELWEQFPKDSSPSPKLIELFKQIRDDERSHAAWNAFQARDLYFKPDPCFLMTNVYGPEHFASAYTLLACVKDQKHPDLEVLQRHFDHLLPQADENLVRAYGHVLQENDKIDQAVLVLAQWNGFESANDSYKELLGKLLQTVSDESFSSVCAQLGPDRLESILSSMKTTILLARLQKIDPEKWIAYEEAHTHSKKPSRDLLLKKAAWLARDMSSNRSAIEEIVLQILSAPQTPEERAARSALKGMEDRAQTEIPKTFSDQFTKKLNSWIAQLDRDIETYQRLSDDWQKIVNPMVQERIQKNLDRMISQIDEAELPSESSEDLVAGFASKKLEIKDQLQQKYSNLLRPS